MTRISLTIRFLSVVLVTGPLLSCHGVEMEIVNVTGTNCILIQTNGGSRVWWVASGQSAKVEGSYGNMELRASWVGSPTPVHRTISNGCSLVVLMRDATGFVSLGFARQWDAEVMLPTQLTWFSGGFGIGLAMLAVGWGFRIIRGATGAADPEP